MHKLSNVLPKQYTEILGSYITGRMFQIKQEEEYSDMREIKAGVPQGSVLGPILYLLFTCDILQTEGLTIATFADDTAILVTGNSGEEAAIKLQEPCNRVND